MATITPAVVVVLALLCCFLAGTAEGGKPGGPASLVEEKITAIKKTSIPAGPAAKKTTAADRKDDVAKPPPRPAKVVQPSTYDIAVNSSGTPGGRKLQQSTGDSCWIGIRNLCRSRKAFLAAFAYYSEDFDSGAGWGAEGWWVVKYSKTVKVTRLAPMYVYTKNGLKPTSVSGSSASLCVSPYSPFTIVTADDGSSFNVYDDDTGEYESYDTCAEAGGYYQRGFWPPKYCGQIIDYVAC